MSDETSQPLEPQWCLIANVREWTRRGIGGQDIQSGTKHFSPGTKVYCCPPQWDQSLALRANVLGRHRGSSKLVHMVIAAKHLTDWRSKLIYDPRILLSPYEGWRSPLWGSDEQAHLNVERWVEWLRDYYETEEQLSNLSGREPALGVEEQAPTPTLGGANLLNYLTRLLQDDPNPKIRVKAVGMLGKLDTVDAVPVLIASMQADDTHYIQHECSRVLRKLGTPDALAAVEAWLREHSPEQVRQSS
jgi:hypothetical protein